ncbi:MAG: ABC transporter ATP-binding protein [Desulfovibrio sp.]|uniref:ABC transporter ATP-binding protein n=1 Tax=Desulfovibrio sp. 7SRBS1 TaxID=3378064 RepID=UPI003B3D0C88
MNQPVLSIRDLHTQFHTSRGVAQAVNGVSLDIGTGEMVALVGESGCGKTMVALSVMGLVPSPPGLIASGEILFKGRDLVGMSEHDLRSVRGNHIGMVFQEPMTSLNPVFRIGEQIAEVLRLHKGMNRKQALEAAARHLNEVGIPSPVERLQSYPHELSGGMRQRVMIAMALACGPELLLADEPTTALDVTIQAQIMGLLDNLRRKHGLSVLLITHDLGVVAGTCDRAAIMYAGNIVERADVVSLFHEPLHPYTRGLLASVPRLDDPERRLASIPGTVPSLLQLPSGCRFHPRCSQAMDICREKTPPEFELGPGRRVACWLHGK